MKSISPHLSSISTSLYIIRIYVTFLHIAVHMCFIRRSSGIWIPHKLYCGSGSGPSCIISNFAFQCQCTRCYLSLPELFSLVRHLSTSYAIDFSTRGKDTTYVSVPPPSTYTPWVCGRTILCILSMWRSIEDAAIAPLQSSKLTLVFFRSQNVPPSPTTLLLYAAVPYLPQMKPGVHTIDLVLPIFFIIPTL